MEESEFNKILDKYGNEIENEIEECFKEKLRDAIYHEFIDRVYKSLEDYVLRKGKRLASCSTLLVYKGYTHRVDKELLKVCAGIELYRHSILIHDDLVDRDELRRGDKSFHRIFEDISTGFGESAGIFAGNILYSLSLDIIQNTKFERKLLSDSITFLNTDYRNVNESQILDVLFEYKKPDEAEWYQMASNRAASLFRATMLIGAILANAPDRDKEILMKAAENIGYAFDIQDDIIGTFAKEEEYGRSPTGDLLRYKKPLHVIYTLKNAPEDVVTDMRDMIKANNFDGVRDIIRVYGLEQAKKKSREHAKNAIALIEKTAMSIEIKNFFKEFISYVSESLDWYK
ncbi:MAG: polyprenyl synthetase family protein [Halobacteriota archaeon]